MRAGALVTYFGGEGYNLLASTLGGLPSPSTNGGCVPADGNVAALVAAGGECPTAGSRVGPPLCPSSPPPSPPAASTLTSKLTLTNTLACIISSTHVGTVNHSRGCYARC